MKIVVIGGTGLIGSKIVGQLRAQGHEALAASPNTGVNSVTGEGLEQALKAASVVIDVSNSPSFEEEAATRFFRDSTRNLLAAEARAGVGVMSISLSWALSPAINGTVEVAGPAEMPIATFVRARLEASNDRRKTVIEADALYFGIRLTERTLLPAAGARLGATTYERWLSQNPA